MSTPSQARRQARSDFIPHGNPRPNENWGMHFTDAYIREWKELQADYEQEQEKQNEPPTLEERVEILEEQVRQLMELAQL